MTDSVREQILADVAEALVGLGTVTRLRDEQVNAFPTLNVLGGAQRVIEDGEEQNASYYEMDVTVELYVKGGGDSALNALYAGAVAAVLEDPTRGGIAEHTKEVTFGPADAPESEAGARYITAPLSFAVRFRTAFDDPTTVVG